MPEITLEEAPQKVRDLFNRGFAAMERGNLEYAIDMFTACVEMEPRFHRGRKFLRAAEIRQFKSLNRGWLTHWFSTVTGLSQILATKALLNAGKAWPAIQMMEKQLRQDPLNQAYIRLLIQAAEAVEEPEIAIQTLALAREHYPRDAEIIDRLGQLYIKTNQTRLARECFETLCELRPNDSAAVKSLKDAMALDSMAKDGWSETAASGGSFRNLIKDEKEATILEKEAKAVKGRDDIDALIAENLARIRREPGNLNYRRALASLYLGNQRFAEAIQTLEEAQNVTGGRDPQVDNALSQVRKQQFEHEIVQLREQGDLAGATAKQQEENAFLFTDVEQRVARYPNDLQLRYEYGVLLLERERINDAIQQFQMAQRNPRHRVDALYRIGVCFKQKGQFDLAAEQLEKAAAELPVLDSQKKDVLYELGLVLEATGASDKALEHYKTIYQADIGYRDIAAKVEKVYRQPQRT